MPSKKVLYPGTFDPITNGHIDILERASKMFDHLVIAVAADTRKKALFSSEERVEIIKEVVLSMELVNIEVKEFKGLLVHFAESEKAYTIIRGIRALSDFEYEFQLSYMNRKMNKNIETIFFPAAEGNDYVSSSFVKEVARLGGDVKDFVPQNVKTRLDICFAGER